MLIVDAALTAATEKGKGTPIFYIILYRYSGGAWVNLGSFYVLEAKLTRLKYDIRVQEDLIGGTLIGSVSGLPYAVEVVRGLSVAGINYTFTSHKYFISKADYLANEGCTDLVADLLPTTAVRDIVADLTAGEVIGNALAAVLVDDFVVDVSKDIWYYWQFYPTTKLLNLYDSRQISGLIANKYFAYFFPREEGLVCYNVPSNFENGEEGNYTPFSHARVRKTVASDHNLNLSWTSETGKQYLTRSVDYAYHTLGFISDTDDPTVDPYFPEWGQTFQHPTFQIEQRPDFRLEQGDLLKFSIDAFDQVRCIDLVEIFKRGKDPQWKQIISDLPYHPQAGSVRIGDFPDDPTPKPTASNILTITDNFTNILSANDSTVQNALDTLDELSRVGTSLPAMGLTGQLFFDTVTGTLSIWTGSSWMSISGAVVSNSLMLMETGDILLLETGDKVVLE
jgi:hypothetical protein